MASSSAATSQVCVQPASNPRRLQTTPSTWPVSPAAEPAPALAAEVVWTRLLSLMLGATVYTFSLIVAFALAPRFGTVAGIAAGPGFPTCAPWTILRDCVVRRPTGACGTGVGAGVGSAAGVAFSGAAAGNGGAAGVSVSAASCAQAGRASRQINPIHREITLISYPFEMGSVSVSESSRVAPVSAARRVAWRVDWAER